jgi:hypothetical protein
MKIGNWLYRLNQTPKIWFEPRDIWMGIYWKQKNISGQMVITDVYICLLPMLPLLISVVAWRKSAQHQMQPTYKQARGALYIEGLNAEEEIRKLRGG